jgi:hypothetical protein
LHEYDCNSVYSFALNWFLCCLANNGTHLIRKHALKGNTEVPRPLLISCLLDTILCGSGPLPFSHFCTLYFIIFVVYGLFHVGPLALLRLFPLFAYRSNRLFSCFIFSLCFFTFPNIRHHTIFGTLVYILSCRMLVYLNKIRQSICLVSCCIFAYFLVISLPIILLYLCLFSCSIHSNFYALPWHTFMF